MPRHSISTACWPTGTQVALRAGLTSTGLASPIARVLQPCHGGPRCPMAGSAVLTGCRDAALQTQRMPACSGMCRAQAHMYPLSKTTYTQSVPGTSHLATILVANIFDHPGLPALGIIAFLGLPFHCDIFSISCHGISFIHAQHLYIIHIPHSGSLSQPAMVR